jgi:hypothetical protein|tara:strand:- start:1474 stop:1725 length:252 start_codon:yes stop_codon:yes gene_type:complete
MENTMDKNTEKFLAKMVEGYEMNMPQVDDAITQLTGQVKNMTEQLEKMETQRDTMKVELVELKELLGLDEEVANDPDLKLVKD